MLFKQGKLILTCLAAFLAAALACLDAEAISLNMAPSKLDLTLRPGRTSKGRIMVDGNSDGAMAFRISLTDWDLREDGTPFFMPAGQHRRTLTPWLRISPTRFTLNPGQAKMVQYELRAPAAISGAYWGAILVEAAPAAEETAGLRLAGRLAVTVYAASVQGGVMEAQVADLQAGYADGRLRAALVLTNRGNLVLRGAGELRLLREGAGAAAAVVKTGQIVVLPSGRRLVKLEWPGRLAPGSYRPVFTFTCGGRKIEGLGSILNVAQ